MEDLLQYQIRDSCRLALPEGLRDLMCDVSREVLRAQPGDLYKFIVDYLSALLLVRDTLPIACKAYRELCECSCQPELDEELRRIGLEGDDLETAKNVVMEYFDKGEVKEGNLLMKLFQKTSIEENLLPSIQGAVRKAFCKHQLKHQKQKSDNIDEASKKVVKHTLGVYGKKYDEDIRDQAATKIQASYRGYVVRRSLEKSRKASQVNPTIKITNEATQGEFAPATRKPGRGIGRLSSYSLAGSFLSLPKYVPYSAHDITHDTIEDREIEHTSFDYELEIPSNLKSHKTDETKKIMFQERRSLERIDSCSNETECFVEEDIAKEDIAEEDIAEEDIVEEDIESEASSVEENITEDIYSALHEIKKREIKGVVSEIIEERQLISTIYEEQKHHIEIIVDELTEENQLKLVTGEEKKHEIELIFDEIIDENQQPEELSSYQDTVKKEYEHESEKSKKNKNTTDFEVEHYVEIGVNGEDHQLVNKNQVKKEYDSELIDDELNDQESIDEELVLEAHYDVIDQNSINSNNSAKEKIVVNVIKPTEDNIMKTQNNELQEEKLTDNSVKSQKGGKYISKWFLKPPSEEFTGQESVKENVFERASGILGVDSSPSRISEIKGLKKEGKK